MPAIPFATQSYQSESLEFSAQRLVNLYAEAIPTIGKTQVVLLGTPALDLNQAIGNGPIRGMIVMGPSLYVASGMALWKVENSGSAVNLGTIGGIGPVQMSENGTQVAVLTGTGVNDLYMATASTVLPVTDVDYPGATSVTFLDGFFVFTKPESGEFFISGSYDGNAFDPLEFATAEGAPDDLVRGVVDHRELWMFGKQTTEVWYNAGNADFPFERASGAYLERGTASAGSIVNLDNTLFWVGDDRIVYRASGYTPRRISTHAIEEKLEEFPGLGDLVAFAYTQKGHAFYVLKKPGAFTFVYDVATGLWHERESHQRPDYRVSSYVKFGDRHLVGDDTSANIYRMNIKGFTGENGESVICRAASPPIWGQTESMIMDNLVIEFQSGVGLENGQGSDPQMMMRFSDNGGKTWSNEKWRGLGRIGDYKRRARWDRLGQFNQRVLEIAISDPVQKAVMGAYVNGDRGEL